MLKVNLMQRYPGYYSNIFQGINIWTSFYNDNCYLAGSACVKYEANPAFWLATWVGKMGLSCPLGIACFVPVFEKKLRDVDFHTSSL